MIKELEQTKKPYQFLNGTLAGKPFGELYAMGQGWNGLLGQLGGKHTFHPSPEKLAYSMATGHAVAAQTVEGKQAGYARLTPWITDAAGGVKMAETPEDFALMQEGGAKAVCVEVGSLVVDESEQRNNLGKHLAVHALQSAQESYPGLPNIAVVTNDNEASLHVFHKLGWTVVSREDAQAQLGIDVLDGWEPPSTIFIYEG